MKKWLYFISRCQFFMTKHMTTPWVMCRGASERTLCSWSVAVQSPNLLPVKSFRLWLSITMGTTAEIDGSHNGSLFPEPAAVVRPQRRLDDTSLNSSSTVTGRITQPSDGAALSRLTLINQVLTQTAASTDPHRGNGQRWQWSCGNKRHRQTNERL